MTWSSHSSGIVNKAFVFLVVVKSPAGVAHTVAEPRVFTRSFSVCLRAMRDPEAPLSSSALIVTDLALPKRVLNLMKVMGASLCQKDRRVVVYGAGIGCNQIEQNTRLETVFHRDSLSLKKIRLLFLA